MKPITKSVMRRIRGCEKLQTRRACAATSDRKGVFAADEVNMVCSMYDRMVVGSMPVAETLRLEAIDPLKAPFFPLTRRVWVFTTSEVPAW